MLSFIEKMTSSLSELLLTLFHLFQCTMSKPFRNPFHIMGSSSSSKFPRKHLENPC